MKFGSFYLPGRARAQLRQPSRYNAEGRKAMGERPECAAVGNVRLPGCNRQASANAIRLRHTTAFQAVFALANAGRARYNTPLGAGGSPLLYTANRQTMTDTTATGWYYALHGERVGPRSLEEVRALVANGVLDADSLVWTPGMREWARVSDFAILSPAWVPPHSSPAPRAEAEWTPSEPAADAADDAPRPLRRFGARMTDFLLYGMVFGSVLMAAAPGFFARVQAAPMESDLRANLIFILGVGVTTVLIESLLLHFAGTTPGKALFGVRVVNQDGTRLSLGQAFSRTLRVWVLGMGAGFMLFTIFAGIAGHFRLTGRGITVWDEQLGLRVEHPELTGAHVLKVVGYLLIFIFALMLILAPFAPPPPEGGGTPAPQQAPAGERMT